VFALGLHRISAPVPANPESGPLDLPDMADASAAAIRQKLTQLTCQVVSSQF